jgi:hypothetical protein
MNILQDVIDLDVFDEKGNLITQIKSMVKGTLVYRDRKHESTLSVKDALFNLDMLKQLGKAVTEESKSDFDKQLLGKQDTVIKFNIKKKSQKLKLIGKGIMYDVNTGQVSHDFQVIIPNVEYRNNYEMKLECGELFNPDYTFLIIPYNDEGDLFDIRLTER